MLVILPDSHNVLGMSSFLMNQYRGSRTSMVVLGRPGFMVDEYVGTHTLLAVVLGTPCTHTPLAALLGMPSSAQRQQVLDAALLMGLVVDGWRLAVSPLWGAVLAGLSCCLHGSCFQNKSNMLRIGHH